MSAIAPPRMRTRSNAGTARRRLCPEPRMTPIDPYRGDRVERVVRVGDLAGQDQALLGRAAQQGTADPRIAGPAVAALGQVLIAEPSKSHEPPRAFDFRERLEELVHGRLAIKRTVLAVVAIRQVLVAWAIFVMRVLGGHEADDHLAVIRDEVAGVRVLADLPVLLPVPVPNAHPGLIVAERQLSQSPQRRRQSRHLQTLQVRETLLDIERNVLNLHCTPHLKSSYYLNRI